MNQTIYTGILIVSIQPVLGGYKWIAKNLETNSYKESKIFRNYFNCLTDAELFRLKSEINRIQNSCVIIDFDSDLIIKTNEYSKILFKIPLLNAPIYDSNFWENEQDRLDNKQSLLVNGVTNRKAVLKTWNGDRLEANTFSELKTVGDRSIVIAQAKILI